MKCIDLMTLYREQPCLGGDKSYLEIRNVFDKSKRMGKSNGDINFTDYWFELVESERNLQGQYVAQHFCLLSDEVTNDGREQFWHDQEGKYAAICLIKIRSDFHSINKIDVERSMTEVLIDNKITAYRYYRTVDNADLVLAIFNSSQQTIEETLAVLKNIEVGQKTVFYSFYSLKGRIQISQSERQRCCTINNPEIEGESIQYYNEIYQDGWCLRKNQELHEKIDSSILKKNRKWVSYYQTLRQILNLLCQYEQERKFKDLFYIFYPPMYLFLEQLGEGIAKGGESSEQIEKSVSEFIDSMEILVHHIGISCVNILNIDGRNGLPYDIPAKLCMQYLAALHTIVKVLNDEGHKYQFCLSPLAYSRPTTNIFEFGLEPADRLIRVSIARHKLYSPRALLGILTHEVSHYVGSYRLRKERAEHYMSICSTILLEKLLPDSEGLDILAKYHLQDQEKKVFWHDWQARKYDIFSYINERIHWQVKMNQYSEAQKYHFAELSESIKGVMVDLLYDSEHRLQYFMDEVYGELDRYLVYMNDNSLLFDACNEVRETLKRNILKTAVEDHLSMQIDDVKLALKEIYADISAILLLKITPIDYLEDYLLSEGCIPDKTGIFNSLLNRVALVNCMVGSVDNEWRTKWDNLDEDALNQNEYLIALKTEADAYLNNYRHISTSPSTGVGCQIAQGEFDVFLLRDVIDEEIEYIKKCIKGLMNRMKIPEIRNSIDMLQGLYNHFVTTENKTFEEFFQIFNEMVGTFKDDIKKEWDNRNRSG